MTAIFIFPIADNLKIPHHQGEQFPIDCPHWHRSRIHQNGIEPQKVSQGIILSVSPFFWQLLKGFTVETNVRPLHGILPFTHPIHDLLKTMPVLLEEPEQRLHTLNGRVDFPQLKMRKRYLNVVPHPYISIARDLELFTHAACSWKKTIRQGRKLEGSLFV